jgi:hypothetical protein
VAAAAAPPPIPDEAYRRKLRRCAKAGLLGISLAVGYFWKAAIGSALADAVEEPAGELADQIAPLLGGRFSSAIGFVALAAAWGEPALKQQIEKLHRKAQSEPAESSEKPDNVHPLNQPPQEDIG